MRTHGAGRFLVLSFALWTTDASILTVVSVEHIGGILCAKTIHPCKEWSPRIPIDRIPADTPADVRKLIEALHSDKPSKRMEAASELGKMGDRAVPALPFLIDLLDDETPLTAYDMPGTGPGDAAFGALAKIGKPAVEPLRGALENATPGGRKRAVWVLKGIYQRFASPEIKAALMRALGDSEAGVRIHAVNALGEIKATETIEPLAAALKDPDPEVRVRVVSVLRTIGGQRALQPLIDALKDPDERVRIASLEALGTSSDPRIVQAHIHALRDASETVRRRAASVLDRDTHGPQTLQFLLDASKDDDGWVRAVAASPLGRIDDPRTIPVLIDALADKDGRVREASASALAWKTESLPAEPLIAALADENPKVRERASAALINTPEEKAVPSLVQALGDQEGNVRASSACTLKRIYANSKDARIVEPMLLAMKDEEREVRKCLLDALGEMNDPRGHDLLVDSLRDSSPEVRRSAARIIGQRFKDSGAVQGLLGGLTDSDAEVRGNAIYALRTIHDPAAVEPLLKVLMELRRRKPAGSSRADWEEPEGVMMALAAIGGPKATNPLIEILKSESENRNIRCGAARSLGFMRVPQSIEPLANVLGEKDEVLRQCALYGLGHSLDPRGQKPLVSALQDKDPAIRSQAARYLGFRLDSASVEPLLQALNDRSAEVRGEAAFSLEPQAGSRAVEALIRLLDDPDSKVRDRAWNSLLNGVREDFGRDSRVWKAWWDKNRDTFVRFEAIELRLRQDETPDVIALLIRDLQETAPYARKRAACLLQFAKKTQGVANHLADLLEDSEPAVRNQGAFSLAALEDARGVGQLLDALKNIDRYVRRDAAEALAKIKDPRGVEPLIGALRDQEGIVVAVAREALKKITGEKFEDPKAWERWWQERTRSGSGGKDSSEAPIRR